MRERVIEEETPCAALPEKAAEITEDSIRRLIWGFYGKVRKDEQLGPVFTAAVGVSDEEWEPHLHQMVDFWSALMLGSGRYQGNPLQKHRALPAFDIRLFDRWLQLFAETAHEIHEGGAAQRYIDTSERIAANLKAKLYHEPKEFLS